MAKRRNFLSDSDVTTLRRLIADVGTLRAQIRTLHERDGKQKRGGAHYLMKAPSGGVPAASGTPSQPGSADCLIQYREGDPKTIHDTTRPEVVYNATGTPISGNALFLAHRDSWGDLWAESVANCPDIGLAPGSYRATAGATIAPGETGPIQVSGGEDCAAVIVDAVNHSECTFYLGERITAHIDKCCTAWFTGCSCCSTNCCDRSVQVCVNNERAIIAVSGGTYTWDVSDVCDCEGATLEVSIACVTEGETTTITATWTLECGMDSDTGTFNISSLCDAEETLIESFIASDICFLLINFSNTLAECATSPQTTNDCWCPNGTIGCSFNGVLFDITGLVANPPFDCDCVNLNGKYLLRYPDDITVETCQTVELARTIPLTCSTGGTDGLRLTWRMQCVVNNIQVTMTAAIISGGLFRPTIASQTNTIAISSFNCLGYTITKAGPAVVGAIDECDATGASVTGKVV